MNRHLVAALALAVFAWLIAYFPGYLSLHPALALRLGTLVYLAGVAVLAWNAWR